MNKPILETERMKLRPLTKDDFYLMRLLDEDPKVVQYLGHGHTRTEEETRGNIHKILNDYEKYGLSIYIAEDKKTKEFLGRTGLIPYTIDEHFYWEVGYSFRPSAWGKGYATEAAKFLVDYGFKNLHVPFLISLIHPENKKSIHVAEKAGMTFWKKMSIHSLYPSLAKLYPHLKEINAAVYRIEKAIQI